MKGSRLFFVVVVLGLGAWAWTALHPGAEKLIRRQLSGVARAASFGPDQGSLAKMASAQRLADYFSSNVEVHIEVPGHPVHTLTGREDIQQAALAARGSVQSLTVSFPDITVALNADHESAIVYLTLRARVAGEQDMIVQELKLTMRKMDGQWLIVKVETTRTLS